MDNRLTLVESIAGVIQCQKDAGHTVLYIIDLERTYRRLLGLAEQMNEQYLSDELVSAFLADSRNSKTGEYRHERFLAHSRCIRFLQSYLDTGSVVIDAYRKPKECQLSDPFKKALDEYDLAEEASGLSRNTLAKNRRPVRYLLEYMTSIGHSCLADIRHGDTQDAIEDMLDRHYDPTSLSTALSGMRRFYEMFPELHRIRMEIPDRMPRKRTIIDVYSDDEQEKIRTYLSSGNISNRNRAICLISFETGLRGVDICNIRIDDVDWKHDSIHIVQSKTKRPLTLPLKASYGNAMLRYLLDERPQCGENYFFLSTHAPYTRLKCIWNIIKDVVSAAGVEADERPVGTRIFRHNAASEMLKKGIPLPVIAEGLGHSSQDSTMIYLSTDRERLSSLTLPLPNGGKAE